jgi:ABC-type transport system involved in multi-copper enzyme maturation permease subunit
MVKEFRSRRFGRLHWLFRLVAVCAIISLWLTYAATMGTLDWGVQTIGGIMVLLQVALIVLLTPALSASLISSERESGGWDLLRMTPLSARAILWGKLLSVMATLLLILFATLPGYLVMIWIRPEMWGEISRVLVSLLWTAVFALLASAAVGSLFRRTAPATTTAYTVLVGLCAGTMLVWLGRDAPFGHSTVETVLTLNPLAAALSVIEMPGFTQYNLVPANWWFLGCASAFCLVVLIVETWRLTRPV